MFRERYGSKYGNKTQEHNGRIFQSKKEAGYAAELDLRKKAKDIKDWSPQERIPLNVNGKHICNYYVDFKVTHNDETIEYVEVKGFSTDVWRMKWKLFEAIFGNDPMVRLTVVR